MSSFLPAYEQPIVVNKLAARYGEREVLHDVSFNVSASEVRVILGGSGCGKTTLLRHMVGLFRPYKGSVVLLGVNFPDCDEAIRDRTLTKVGMLFQGGALLGGLTVLENVALPIQERTFLPPDIIADMAWMKLTQVGLSHAAAMLPAQLSGGMRKRAALARAMALDPAILFCDEPSAGLDPVTAAELDALILSLRDQFGMAIVVVTHELASIRTIADKVLMLDKGNVVADGPLPMVEQMDNPFVRAFFDRMGSEQKARGPSVWDKLQPQKDAG